MSKLNITPDEKLSNWKAILLRILESGTDVYAVGDTETTGTHENGDKKTFGRKDRILEVGLLFYTKQGTKLVPVEDSEGTHVFFHEYINPFRESSELLERHYSTTSIPAHLTNEIHGIDKPFLLAEKGLVGSGQRRTDFVLSSPAPTFGEIKPILEELLSLDKLIDLDGRLHFIAHNAMFDVRFLNEEWKRVERLEEGYDNVTCFEAYFNTIDTLALMHQMYTGAELQHASSAKGLSGITYNLDSLQTFYDITADRDMHGALIDSKILAQVYGCMLEDPAYTTSKLAESKKLGAQVTRKPSHRNLVKIPIN